MSNKHQHYYPAPHLDVLTWVNIDQPLALEELKGKVVVIHAFQMLCPGCVAHGLPQANTIHQHYRKKDVQVIGLHTVFEHHEVMTREALEVFVHEYRIPFPIAIDKPSDKGPIPYTMSKYQMQGTPTLIVIDKFGHVRLNHFGQISDMQVGSIIGGLLKEKSSSVRADETQGSLTPGESQKCGEDGCLI